MNISVIYESFSNTMKVHAFLTIKHSSIYVNKLQDEIAQESQGSYTDTVSDFAATSWKLPPVFFKQC